MMRWTLLLLVSVLTSCSAHYHLRRAVKKDPSILQKDTITVVDTIVTPPVALTDTVVLRHMDTIMIQKDRLKVKIMRSFDTLRVDAICDADTIISIVEVPVERIIYQERETPMQKLQKLGLYLLAALVLWKVIEAKLLKR